MDSPSQSWRHCPWAVVKNIKTSDWLFRVRGSETGWRACLSGKGMHKYSSNSASSKQQSNQNCGKDANCEPYQCWLCVFQSPNYFGWRSRCTPDVDYLVRTPRRWRVRRYDGSAWWGRALRANGLRSCLRTCAEIQIQPKQRAISQKHADASQLTNTTAANRQPRTKYLLLGGD